MENKKKKNEILSENLPPRNNNGQKKKGVILNRVDKKLKKDHQVERTIKPAA